MAKSSDVSIKEAQETIENPAEAAEAETPVVTPDASGVDAAQVLAAAGDQNVRNAIGEEELSGEFAGFKVGRPAPEAKWLDKDGVTVLDEPRFTDGVGAQLVREGETVTPHTLTVLRNFENSKKNS